MNRPLAEETEESLGVNNPFSNVPNNSMYLAKQNTIYEMNHYRYDSVENKPKDKKNPSNNHWNYLFTYPVADKKL